VLGGPQNVHLFIHTWQSAEASVSYRALQSTPRTIDETQVRAYYKDVGTIQSLIISTDTEADGHIVGSRESKLAHMPILGWKRMWYGIHTITQQMIKAHQVESYSTVLNMRCDMLTVQKNNILPIDGRLSIQRLLTMIIDGIKRTETAQPYLRFLLNYPGNCVDNLYIGSPEGHLQLAEHFWTKMDEIVEMYNQADVKPMWHPNHEKVVFFEANRLGLLN
jgi:hypothetical protein